MANDLTGPRRAGFGLRKTIGEFAVIVIGVLTALAVDSWAGGRRDARLEQEYLQRLEQDVAQTLENLRANEGFHALVAAHARRALDVLEQRAPEARIGESYAALYNASRGDEPEFFKSTYQELIATGALRLIRDAMLRSELAGYYLEMEAYLESHSGWDDRDPYRNRIRRLIPPEYQAKLVAECPLAAESGACATIIDDARARDALRELMTDQELRRDLALWLAAQPNLAAATRRRRTATEKLLQSVQAARKGAIVAGP